MGNEVSQIINNFYPIPYERRLEKLGDLFLDSKVYK